MKRFILILLMILFSAISCFADNNITANVLPSVKGIVKSVEYIDSESDNQFVQAKQSVKIQLKDKNLSQEYIEVENILTGNPYYDIKIKKGMTVILHRETDGTEIEYTIQDVERSKVLIVLSVIFCSLLMYVGKKKGVCSLISILLTCLMINYFLTPMILSGISPIVATLLICILSTLVTMYFVGGFNQKSSSAALGCILSIFFALVLSLLTIKFAYLTGYTNENSMFLFSSHPDINLVEIVAASMLLAALGAVMDVSMSIASTINEIHLVDKTKTIKELFKCGMNVGRDIIGTMANTLILVYLGSSIPLLLLLSNIDLQKFFNLNQVVTEVASALIGSCSIVICVPLTAIVTANLVKLIKNESADITPDDFNN